MSRTLKNKKKQDGDKDMASIQLLNIVENPINADKYVFFPLCSLWMKEDTVEFLNLFIVVSNKTTFAQSLNHLF